MHTTSSNSKPYSKHSSSNSSSAVKRDIKRNGCQVVWSDCHHCNAMSNKWGPLILERTTTRSITHYIALRPEEQIYKSNSAENTKHLQPNLRLPPATSEWRMTNLAVGSWEKLSFYLIFLFQQICSYTTWRWDFILP